MEGPREASGARPAGVPHGDLARDPGRRRRLPRPSPHRSPCPRAPDAGAPTEVTDLPTQAGMPVFHDDDEVDWLRARAERPEPPPPLEESRRSRCSRPTRRRASPYADRGPAAVPRRATGTTGPGTSPRTPPRLARQDSGVRPVGRDTGSWASASWAGERWGTGEGIDDTGDQVPGRSWIRLAMIVGISVLVLVAAVAAYQLGLPAGHRPGRRAASSATSTPSTAEPDAVHRPHRRRLRPAGPTRPRRTPTRSPTSSTATRRPRGAPRPTSRTSAPPASRPASAWSSTSAPPRACAGSWSPPPAGRRRWRRTSPRRAPTGVAGLTPVGTASGTGELTISLDEAVSGRYVTIWLTLLPPVDGGFRGTIAEVQVLG